jgi:hypothetical protein
MGKRDWTFPSWMELVMLFMVKLWIKTTLS